MPTATWGESELQDEPVYPLPQLKHLLHQMITQFSAYGGCIALFDEDLGQMVVRVHVRLRAHKMLEAMPGVGDGEVRLPPGRRSTINLQDPSASAVGRLKRSLEPQEELEDATLEMSDLFPVGTAYPMGQGLIGYTWRENRSSIMQHDGYLSAFYSGHKALPLFDVTPTWYFAIAIQEAGPTPAPSDRKRQPRSLGVVVLYQTTAVPGFHLKQRHDALAYTERMALYLQNHALRLAQRRTSDYLQQLQQLSATFPSTVNLSSMLEHVYHFASHVVDVSAMQCTLYDRDSKKIYDIYAIHNGKAVEGLPTKSVEPSERLQWWRVTQQEKRTLLFNPAHYEGNEYDELLQGVWGDQRNAESFLLLPMKMFTRVIGSLCLTSAHANAYHKDEIQILETMVQVITISIENAKLYERSRQALRKARHREESLAAMNSALQSISSVLNLTEMLDSFVKAVSDLVQAEMCVFFQLSRDQEELIAQALYAPKSRGKTDEILLFQTDDKDKHTELIEMIHLAFKGSLLANLVEESAFFYLDPPMVEEIAQASEEGGKIFLRETHIQKMIMIPMRYQTELMGVLAIHTPKQSRVFRPEEVGMLLAICSQAASAIRNAQLFEQIHEANAELQHMNKLKDEFIVTASHELRTPLSAISGYASLLKRQNARTTPEQVLRFAGKIGTSAQQLTALVSNMTEAANMDAQGKNQELQITNVQLHPAAQTAANMVSINSEQKIALNIADTLWLCCDALRLRQVLTNLLDNAAKYSPQDSTIELIASATTLAQVPLPEEMIDHALVIERGEDLPVVLIRVYDEGEGILPEDQQRIFEKFVRAPRSLTTPVRGSGLGLYICRRYVEEMGGKLWLEQSIPGEGSVFSFYLPQCTTLPEAEAGERGELETEAPDAL